jgi:hypothetical protein
MGPAKIAITKKIIPITNEIHKTLQWACLVIDKRSISAWFVMSSM